MWGSQVSRKIKTDARPELLTYLFQNTTSYIRLDGSKLGYRTELKLHVRIPADELFVVNGVVKSSLYGKSILLRLDFLALTAA